MRISDDRYSRDRARFDIALHFIRHEARTRTIRTWTGLSDDRIRKLYRTYLNGSDHSPVRHRGKSPQQAAFFTRNPRMRSETAHLASLCVMTGALPDVPAPDQVRSLPSLARAGWLCQAYDVYRATSRKALISFEHAVFLMEALVRGDELRLGGCRECAAVLVVDRWSLRSPHCLLCGDETTTQGH
jgi:Flagellar transcriptional activator (FlhC)